MRTLVMAIFSLAALQLSGQNLAKKKLLGTTTPVVELKNQNLQVQKIHLEALPVHILKKGELKLYRGKVELEQKPGQKPVLRDSLKLINREINLQMPKKE